MSGEAARVYWGLGRTGHGADELGGGAGSWWLLGSGDVFKWSWTAEVIYTSHDARGTGTGPSLSDGGGGRAGGGARSDARSEWSRPRVINTGGQSPC